MVVLLLFIDDVILRERKRVQTDIQQLPTTKFVAIFLENLERAVFDIGWVSTGIRIAVDNAPNGATCG